MTKTEVFNTLEILLKDVEHNGLSAREVIAIRTLMNQEYSREVDSKQLNLPFEPPIREN